MLMRSDENISANEVVFTSQALSQFIEGNNCFKYDRFKYRVSVIVHKREA